LKYGKTGARPGVTAVKGTPTLYTYKMNLAGEASIATIYSA